MSRLLYTLIRLEEAMRGDTFLVHSATVTLYGMICNSYPTWMICLPWTPQLLR